MTLLTTELARTALNSVESVRLFAFDLLNHVTFDLNFLHMLLGHDHHGSPGLETGAQPEREEGDWGPRTP